MGAIERMVVSTVSRRLPPQPHLDVPKREARELLNALRSGKPEAQERVRRRHPKYKDAEIAALTGLTFRLSDAQWVIACEYGFSKWADLKRRVESNAEAQALEHAIRADDRAQAAAILRQNPDLLHIPVRSGNWGPPMSHAANLGRLALSQDFAALGARDFQQAFDRAILQGHIDCARWLHSRGAQLLPGLIMSACETLNAAGVRFLAEAGAPFTDERGDRLAPLAMVLGTYSRFPEGKHEILQLFASRGFPMPDTPMMALHRGDASRLGEFLRSDARLVDRRFGCEEIFPRELGCREAGMTGTSLDGTTLLHIAIDYDEQEIFDLLIAHGADVNAAAAVDADGFGGQTPLFNAAVSCAYLCGRQRGGSMARTLLERGASPGVRASLRKFLDWIERPRWHAARAVTASEWGRSFPLEGWANPDVLAACDSATGR